MTCISISAGRALDCRRGIGGVRSVYIANASSVYVPAASGSGVTISSIVTAQGATTNASFYKFDMEKETALFTNPPVANVQNGSIYFDEILTVVFNQPDNALVNSISGMAHSNLVAIVELANGTYRILGSENGGLVISGGDGGSGTASGDRNGYSLQFRSFSEHPARFVTGLSGSAQGPYIVA